MSRPVPEPPSHGREGSASSRLGVDVVGRSIELGVIDDFVAAAEAGPAALLIEGAGGAGKTTIWRAAIAVAGARAFRILSCRPAEAEASLAYAGLGDLLDGMLDDPSVVLPPPQRRALGIATLAESSEEEPRPLAIGVATLGVLRSLSVPSPVLIAIDDVQWLDLPSARVIEFALRRLRGERVGVVVVLRAGERPPLDAAPWAGTGDGRVFRIRVGPMSVDELDELFRRRLDASLPRPVLGQVQTASDGNPLFALELARAIVSGELQPRAGERLAVPETLQELLRERVSALPVAVRDALGVAAAAAEPTLELLERAGVQSPEVADPVGAGVRAGIVYVAAGRVEFTHPLFASTLYYELAPERRRELHARLAQLVADPLDRARHLALAASGPHAAVADVLAEAARGAARRGAPDAGAGLFEQAARLTPPADAALIVERRTESAELHFAAGDTSRAKTMLEALTTATPPGPVRAGLLRRLAKVRYSTDSVAVAAELLSRALSEAGDDSSLRAGIERDLAWAVSMCGDARQASEHAAAAIRVAEREGDAEVPLELIAASAMTRFTLGDASALDALRYDRGPDPRDRAIPIEWRPSTVTAVMRKAAGDLDAAEAAIAALRRRAAEEGEETALPFLLAQLSEIATLRGNWRHALGLASEADATARQTGQEAIRAGALYAKALAEAHLGDAVGVSRTAAEGLQVAERVGSVMSMMLNQSVLGFVELSIGRPDSAYRHLAPLAAWQDVVGIQEPGMVRFVPDLVETLVALGDSARADALLTPFEKNAHRLGRPVAKLAAARARALILSASGQLAAAVASVERAVAERDVSHFPFERGRALLVLGSVERRTRRRRSARTHIEAALHVFEDLGAGLWTERARSLLGEPAGEPLTWASKLTPAERRVAELVGAGGSNREVADRLFVTVRTVELHLTNVYRKLGITSRAQLARLLAGASGEVPPGAARGPGSSRR